MPVLVRRGEMDEPWHVGTEPLVVGGDAGRRQRAHGDTVVGHLAGEDLDLFRLSLQPPVVAGDLQRRLIRFRPTGGELEVVEVAGEERRQPRRELDRRWGCEAEEIGDERDLTNLSRSHIGQFGPAMADINVPQAGEGIDVALAIRVPEEDVFSPYHDERTVISQGPQVRERVEEMRLVLINELRGVPCLYDGHVPSHSRQRPDTDTVALSRRNRLAGVASGSPTRFSRAAAEVVDGVIHWYAEAADRGIGGARGTCRGDDLPLEVRDPASQ